MSKNHWSGLQFRIMETLEKQPNHAPLTAVEIADILHASEYRGELKDNVVFKVSRAVHGMKEQGKIILADARDAKGRLCYQLPMRTKFPPQPAAAPANPVLTPELAQQIKTVEPAAPKKKGAPPVYVTGIQDKIVEFLDKAEHPQTAHDITQGLKHLYEGKLVSDDPNRIRDLFSGNLYYMATKKRSIYRRKVTGYGPGVSWEYYTKRTGTAPHPLSFKAPVKGPSAAVHKAAVSKPHPVPTSPLAQAATVVGTPQPTMPQIIQGFRPQKPEANDIEVKFRWPATFNQRVVEAAKLSDLSISEFVRQAVNFAIDNLQV